jgi:UDP-N-acetylmuramoyl-tripeptide--D-alanyl-D-alanine ligase
LFQQEHYDPRKFLIHAKNFYWTDIRVLSLYMAFSLIYINLNAVLNWLITLFVIGLIFVFDKMIIGLKLTKRIFRFLATYMILVALEGFFLISVTNEAFACFIITFIMPADIMAVNYLNFPLEHVIGLYYIRKAKNKLSQSNHLLKIGITGSYGKTTTKNILGSILATKYLTVKTPASYNTPMGISKCTNQELKPQTEIFIAEMGAFRIGEIRFLSDIVRPKVGIVTAVGPQHISTFKTVERVLQTKMELIEALPEDGIGIVNTDNEYIKGYQGHPRCRMISFAIHDESADYQGRNLAYYNLKMVFDIYHHGKLLLTATTSLLGVHNAYNILAGVACAMEISAIGYKIPVSKILEGIERMEGVPHRLKLEQRGKMAVLDDSYNSNIDGFLSAIDVASRFERKKILITPGIVDAGKKQGELNRRVASSITKVFNGVYLISNPATKEMAKFFEEVDYRSFQVYQKFQEAYADVVNKYQNEEIVLLIENDLPDNFLERK